MLKYKRIAKNFAAIEVGKEYNGKPYYWTTFYYYKGLIVDTGCPHTAEEAVNFVDEMKLDVKAVLLTHYHEDHSGGAHLFKERFNVDVFAPQKSIKVLAFPPRIPMYRQIVWGQPKPVEAYPLKGKMDFKPVELITIETPGHSFDHVSFLTENLMFIGDLVTNRMPVIVMREEDYIDLANSLKTVVNLDFKTAYGGHGIWDKNSIKAALNNTLELKKTVDMLRSIGLNAEQIVEKILSKVPKKVLLMEEISEYEWSRKNLVESLLGIRHKPSGSSENKQKY